jgi:signal recognition particle subunit SRP68
LFLKITPCCRAVYEELGKYGDLENQVLCRERVEELEPSIRYCLHKIGKSNLQTSELLQIGEMEGPALDLFKAKIEVCMNIRDQIYYFFVSVPTKASE